MREFILNVNEIIMYVCQILAIFVISVGILKGAFVFVKDALFGRKAMGAIRESRLEMGHAFSLGLGFLIGASILKTTFAPNWNEIGQLASIIGIRTILNYFLLKEIGVLGKGDAADESQSGPAEPSVSGKDAE